MSIRCAITDSVWSYAEISRLGNFLPNGNIRVENIGNVTVKVGSNAKLLPGLEAMVPRPAMEHAILIFRYPLNCRNKLIHISDISNIAF